MKPTGKAAPAKAAAKAAEPSPKKSQAAAEDSDDDGPPPLEPVGAAGRKGSEVPAKTAPPKKKPAAPPSSDDDDDDSDDGPPPLEPITSPGSKAPSKPATTQPKQAQKPQAANDDDDDDGPPPLEPIRGDGATGTENVKVPADLKCKVCDITLSNAMNYISHVNGKKHQKKVAEKEAAEQGKSKAAVPDTVLGEVTRGVDQEKVFDYLIDLYKLSVDDRYSKNKELVGYYSGIASGKGRDYALGVAMEHFKTTYLDQLLSYLKRGKSGKPTEELPSWFSRQGLIDVAMKSLEYAVEPEDIEQEYGAGQANRMRYTFGSINASGKK